jgi:hypothetical protein
VVKGTAAARAAFFGRMVVSVDDPKYWHDKALEVRAMERRASDPQIKRMLTEIAQRYDAIARLTAERVEIPKTARRKWKRLAHR